MQTCEDIIKSILPTYCAYPPGITILLVLPRPMLSSPETLCQLQSSTMHQHCCSPSEVLTRPDTPSKCVVTDLLLFYLCMCTKI